jgi:hypothetical protein
VTSSRRARWLVKKAGFEPGGGAGDPCTFVAGSSETHTFERSETEAT